MKKYITIALLATTLAAPALSAIPDPETEPRVYCEALEDFAGDMFQKQTDGISLFDTMDWIDEVFKNLEEKEGRSYSDHYNVSISIVVRAYEEPYVEKGRQSQARRGFENKVAVECWKEFGTRRDTAESQPSGPTKSFIASIMPPVE